MSDSESPRRRFLRRTGVAAATALASRLAPVEALAQTRAAAFPYDHRWLDTLTRPARQVFDVPNDGEGFAYRFVRNYIRGLVEGYGLPAGDVQAVMALHGLAVLTAVSDATWAKYRLGSLRAAQRLKGTTDARNPYLAGGRADDDVVPPDFAVQTLQAQGTTVLVCHNATRYAASVVAQARQMETATVLADFEQGFAPGVVLVPAAVAALQRAQAKGCTYVVVTN